MAKLKFREIGRNRYFIVILIWFLLIITSIQARTLLTEGIESTEEFTGDESESAMGDLLVEERFNTTAFEVSHVIIIDLGELGDTADITSLQWRNFTLFLSMYVNQSTFELGYDQPPMSEPALLAAGLPDFASSMVSANKQYGMINIASTTLTVEGEHGIEEFADHVDVIRELLDEENMDNFFKFVETMIGTEAIPLFMPTIEDAKAIRLILTGNVANFVDTMEVAESTFNDSEIIAVIVVIIILAMVFRSPMGIFLPIISMVAALFPTYLITFLMGKAGLFAINDFLPSIIAMIGIAVAVDYNLFSMVRYREEYRRRKAEHELANTWTKENRQIAQEVSAKVMNATAGNAVMFSGFTVITGFGAMLVLGSEFTLGMALSVACVVMFSILTARTLTPAILS
ncbi:MAG: MMPL family transporter, partial [Candidatus Kariarchaeaceae archaeon]